MVKHFRQTLDPHRTGRHPIRVERLESAERAVHQGAQLGQAAQCWRCTWRWVRLLLVVARPIAGLEEDPLVQL
jgi:hypothetical protein